MRFFSNRAVDVVDIKVRRTRASVYLFVANRFKIPPMVQ